MRLILAISAAGFLGACAQERGIGFGRYDIPADPPTGTVSLTSEQLQAAEQVIAGVIMQEFPAAAAEPAANCGIAFATPEEATFLASASAQDTIARQNVLTVLARPSTQECLSENGVSLL